jgi:sarcosine oxidase subunit alpha
MKVEYLSITVDGEIIKVGAGRSLAAALIGAGVRRLRRSPRAAQPRGAFCMMGVCQECLVHVDGKLEQACLKRVRPGMNVVLGM